MRASVCSALHVDLDWATQRFELTPYKLNLLESLAKRMDDPDVPLCEVLRRGAPTGVRRPIPHRGCGRFSPTENARRCAMFATCACAPPITLQRRGNVPECASWFRRSGSGLHGSH